MYILRGFTSVLLLSLLTAKSVDLMVAHNGSVCVIEIVRIFLSGFKFFLFVFFMLLKKLSPNFCFNVQYCLEGMHDLSIMAPYVRNTHTHTHYSFCGGQYTAVNFVPLYIINKPAIRYNYQP